MITYKIRKSSIGEGLVRIDEQGFESWVPEATGNRHYEEYLEWVAEGNEPEVIDA